MTKSDHRRRRHSASDDAGAPGHRQARLEQTILREMSLLLQDVSNPILLDVIVSAVALAGDGGMARIHYTVPPETSTTTSKEIQTALERASGFLRAGLATGLDLKRTPLLRFVAGPAGGSADPEDAWWK